MKYLLILVTVLFVNTTWASEVQLPKTCEGVLSPTTCTKLREVARKFNEKVEIVNQAIKEAYLNQKTKVTEVYNYVKEYLVTQAQNVKCTDFLNVLQCKKLIDLSKTIHLSTRHIQLILKESYIDGIESTKELYNKVATFIQEKIFNLKCEDMLSKGSCEKIRVIADKFQISMKKIEETLREAISKGVTKVSDLYKAAIDYVTKKWTAILGDAPMKSKRSIITDKINEIAQKLKDKLLDAARKFLEALKVTDQKIVAAVKEAINNGKISLLNLRNTIKDLIASMKNSTAPVSTDQASLLYAQSAQEQQLASLKVAYEKVKEFINRLLSISSTHLQELKKLIKEKLKVLGISFNEDELESDFKMVEVLVHTSTEKLITDVKKAVLKDDKELNNDLKKSMVKRSGDNLNDRILAFLEKHIIDKVFSEKHSKAIDKWIESHKYYIEVLMKFAESEAVRKVAEYFTATFLAY